MRKLLKRFLQLESASGMLLLMTAVLAIILANSPLARFHQQWIDTSLFYINEGLMAVFFLLVGLELKRGYIEGPLSSISQIILPGGAALGGMLIPAAVYWLVNHQDPIALKGWATPVATDIAFALGVLSLFDRRVPLSLKLFLLALAIFDDVGAILIIALFFSTHISLVWLFLAGICVLITYLFKQLTIEALPLYLLMGAALWLTLWQAGVHPTIAGVLLAFMIPHTKNKSDSPLQRLESLLHPWVAYLIMPLFALANAGFSLQSLTLTMITHKIVIGIVAGLVLGKQLGIMVFSWVLIYFGFAKLPEKVRWPSFYGVAILCGIGFTMSLFLGTLSFQGENIYLAEVRVGVIIGSLVSGLLGSVILLIALPHKPISKE